MQSHYNPNNYWSSNIGVMTTGVENIIGSLMLKIEGIIQILPIDFKRVDLANSINTFKANVAPNPPIVIKALVYITSLVDIFVAGFPAATAAILAVIPAINIGVETALNDQADIPKVNKKVGIKLNSKNPGRV